MAEHQVVQIEPTGTQGGKKLDKNGDEIIAEAECYQDGVCYAVCSVYALDAISASGLLYYCFAICCGIKAMYSWKLYLTSTGIRYTDVIKLCCCSYKHYFISLSDINDIQVKGRTILLTMNLGVEVSSLSLTQVRNAEEFATAVKQQMAVSNST